MSDADQKAITATEVDQEAVIADLKALVSQLQRRLIGADLLRARVAELESTSRVAALERHIAKQQARIRELEAALVRSEAGG